MFSFISQNWKGKPLTDYEVIINFIKNTTTEKGLQIFARLDKKEYKKGLKFSDEEMEKNKLGKEHNVEEILLKLRNLKCKVYDDEIIICEPNKQQKEILQKFDIFYYNGEYKFLNSQLFRH